MSGARDACQPPPRFPYIVHYAGTTAPRQPRSRRIRFCCRVNCRARSAWRDRRSRQPRLTRLSRSPRVSSLRYRSSRGARGDECCRTSATLFAWLSCSCSCSCACSIIALSCAWCSWSFASASRTVAFALVAAWSWCGERFMSAEAKRVRSAVPAPRRRVLGRMGRLVSDQGLARLAQLLLRDRE